MHTMEAVNRHVRRYQELQFTYIGSAGQSYQSARDNGDNPGGRMEMTVHIGDRSASLLYPSTGVR